MCRRIIQHIVSRIVDREVALPCIVVSQKPVLNLSTVTPRQMIAFLRAFHALKNQRVRKIAAASFQSVFAGIQWNTGKQHCTIAVVCRFGKD